MRKTTLLILILFSIRVSSQNATTGSIYYNPNTSTLNVIFSNIKFLPDSLLSYHIEQLRIEKCQNLNFKLLFKQLATKDELHTQYLRDCNINSLPKGVAEIPNLKVLILDNNNLKSISRKIKKMELDNLVVTRNNIGSMSYEKQSKFFAAICNLTSFSGMNISLRSNGLDSLPDSFRNINLIAIDISENNFKYFPNVITSMVNDGSLRNITVDNIPTLLFPSNALSKIQNKYNRSYVNVIFDCFVDTLCISDKDLIYLNNTFPAIHFSIN